MSGVRVLVWRLGAVVHLSLVCVRYEKSGRVEEESIFLFSLCCGEILQTDDSSSAQEEQISCQLILWICLGCLCPIVAKSVNV